MPRNSAGAYTLPAGNPVVTGTIISSTWANTTLADIGNEITQSLDRSGDGGMLAPLQLVAGAIGTPGLTWSLETTSGLYRAGAGDFRYSISGTDRLQLTAALFKLTVPEFELEDSAPLIHVDETDAAANERHWIFRSVGGIFGLSTATDAAPTTAVGTAFSFDRTGTTVSVGTFAAAQTQFADGLVGTPVLSFVTDPDSGFYRIGANQIGMSLGGALVFNFATSGIYIPDGTLPLPSYSFQADPDTGFRRAASNQIHVTAGGVDICAIYAQGVQVTFGQLLALDGTAGAPGIAFSADQDTGLFRSSGNNFGLYCAGAEVLGVGPGDLRWNLNVATLVLGGGASALPALPVGYVGVTINGTLRRIPFYAN